MFAINHAAAALVFKKKFEEIPMVWFLVGVQASELLWAVLNFVGIEHTTTSNVIHTVHDIHLASIQYSHSLMGAIVLALLAGVVARFVLRKPMATLAVSLAVLSHIALDLATHAR